MAAAFGRGTVAALSRSWRSAARRRCSGTSGGQRDARGPGRGDSLISDLPTIVSDLQRIDTAGTALQQQIDQDCG